MDRLRSSFEIVVSYNTILELLSGLCESVNGNYFRTDQRRFMVAIGTDLVESAIYLDTPVEHGFEFGPKIQRPETGIGKARTRDYVRTVLTASSLTQLRTGVRWPGDDTGKHFLRCELVTADVSKGQAIHIQTLQAAKEGKLDLDNQLLWALNFGRFYNYELDEEQVKGMATALDAVYNYQKRVWAMSIKDNFKPDSENNEGDWLDMNQLFYLADPLMHFLTDDSGIKERCKDSNQVDRILRLKDYLPSEGLTL